MPRASKSAGEIFGDNAKDYHFAKVKEMELACQSSGSLTELFNRPLQTSCVLEGVKFD